MVRSAAKNHKDVAIVVNNQDFDAILAEMDQHQNSLTLETRFDLAIKAFEHTAQYDSMIAKVLVHGKDRQEAIRKMKGALEEMLVLGVETNLDFQYKIMQSEAFVEGKVDTGFIERFTLGGK